MKWPPSGLLILGFGGHARSVADIALACGVKNLLFVDQQARPEESFLGFPVLARWDERLPCGWMVFPAAGKNSIRRLQCAEAIQRGWPLATVVAPTATLGAGCQLGEGTLVAQHAHIGPMAVIGMGCIINTAAVIEHEVLLGAYTHVSVNACIAGRCTLGEEVFIGAGATVIDGIRICDQVILAAGGCAICPLDFPGTYMGVPAKKATVR